MDIAATTSKVVKATIQICFVGQAVNLVHVLPESQAMRQCYQVEVDGVTGWMEV